MLVRRRFDAWGTGKTFRKMTCSGWYDMTKEVGGFTVPINAGWDGADPVMPPEIKEETLAKNADGKFDDVTPCALQSEVELACPIACGVTREDWLVMVAKQQYPDYN